MDPEEGGDKKLPDLEKDANVDKKISMSLLNFNEILSHIGEFGRWQQLIFFWACIVAMVNGVVTVSFVFTAYVPKYRCSIPFCEAKQNWSYFENDELQTFPEFVDFGIPEFVLEKSGGVDCRYFGMTDLTSEPTSGLESCEFYLSEVSRNSTDISLMDCQTDTLIYDKSIVDNSIVTDFGLSCDRSSVKNVIGTTYMIGVLIGSLVAGIFADKFGRLTTLMVGSVATAVSGLAGAFVTSPEAFAFFRFMTGFFVKGLYMMAFIISVECVGPRFTAIVGIALNIPFAIGELILGLEAYFVRDWRTLQILVHAPVLGLVLLWFFLPESPRWLIAVGNTKNAEKILTRAAKMNRKSIPGNLIQGPDEKKEKNDLRKTFSNLKVFVENYDFKNELFSKKTSEVNAVDNDAKSEHVLKPSFLDLFRPRKMMWRTVNLCLQWFSVTFVYYGLSFGSTSLSGDPYSNFCLNVFVEIPGYVFAMSVMDCWGRKPILAFCQVLPGLACVFAGLLVGNFSMGPLQIFLSLVGKFGASAGFAIVYLYSAELYPTILRSTSLGTCSLVARFGSILALLVELTSSFWMPFPMVLMGSVSIVAGFAALLLPESTGSPLPETTAEALKIGTENKRNICSCDCPNSWRDFFPKIE